MEKKLKVQEERLDRLKRPVKKGIHIPYYTGTPYTLKNESIEPFETPPM
jgi:hypothetical protein